MRAGRRFLEEALAPFIWLLDVENPVDTSLIIDYVCSIARPQLRVMLHTALQIFCSGLVFGIHGVMSSAWGSCSSAVRFSQVHIFCIYLLASHRNSGTTFGTLTIANCTQQLRFFQCVCGMVPTLASCAAGLHASQLAKI